MVPGMTEHTSTMGGERKLLTAEQLAAELEIPLRTIYNWRHRGVGPRSIKVGRHLRYRRADIDAWLDTQAGR